MVPMSSSRTSIRPTMRAGVLPLLSAVSRTAFADSRNEGEKASAQSNWNDMLLLLIERVGRDAAIDRAGGRERWAQAEGEEESEDDGRWTTERARHARLCLDRPAELARLLLPSPLCSVAASPAKPVSRPSARPRIHGRRRPAGAGAASRLAATTASSCSLSFFRHKRRGWSLPAFIPRPLGLGARRPSCARM